MAAEQENGSGLARRPEPPGALLGVSGEVAELKHAPAPKVKMRGMESVLGHVGGERDLADVAPSRGEARDVHERGVGDEA